MTSTASGRVFLAGPFKNLLDPETGLLSYSMQERFRSIIRLLEQKGFDVHCAHRREGWGAKMMTPSECTRIDFEEISAADILLAFPGMPASPGTHIELGWASALKKRIILLLEHGKEYAFLVRGLHQVADVTDIVFKGDSDLIDQLDTLFSGYADELGLRQA